MPHILHDNKLTVHALYAQKINRQKLCRNHSTFNVNITLGLKANGYNE